MRTSIEKIKQAVSGEDALADIREIANYHRIQASPGYRAAAEHIVRKLTAQGFDCTLRSYPVTANTWYYAAKMFMEWSCNDAMLRLTDTGEILADFRKNPISIIQRSYTCDYRNKALDIVLLDKGNKKEPYAELDLQGKLIFVREPFKDFVEWAVKEKGAVGIITDCIYSIPGVRTQAELYDIRNYTSFWLQHTDDEAKAFGFVLTPRQGDILAKRCAAYKQEHALCPEKPAYPRATCFVDACFYDGAVEVVDTLLPGESDEEIVAVAHLCHPRMSANDNASGVAACMAALYSLKYLIDSGDIPPLKRSIRVLFMPEFTGTYAYLHDTWKENKKIKAGINLDMVGGRQGSGYGPLTISGLPDACASFVMDLARIIMDEVSASGVAHSEIDKVSLVNTAEASFDAGSDNYIFSDPTIGIPMPMLGQWPDINYHTSGDTPEVIDPKVLQVSASFGAAYAYSLANLSLADADLVLKRNREVFVRNIHRLYTEDMYNTIEDAGWKLEYIRSLHQRQNAGLLAFFKAEERAALKEKIAQEDKVQEHIAHLYSADTKKSSKPQNPVPKDYQYIPVRLYKTPIQRMDDFIHADHEAYADYKDYVATKRHPTSPHRLEALIQYHINGRDTLAEIVAAITMQARGVSIESVHAYVQLLRRLGMVSIKGE